VRIELDLAALPVAEGVAEVAGQLGTDPATFAATAGEDYELCACVPERARAVVESDWHVTSDVALTWIGRVIYDPARPAGLEFAGATGELSGYEHSP
jgi:thiamine-monophosphate kinase